MALRAADPNETLLFWAAPMALSDHILTPKEVAEKYERLFVPVARPNSHSYVILSPEESFHSILIFSDMKKLGRCVNAMRRVFGLLTEWPGHVEIMRPRDSRRFLEEVLRTEGNLLVLIDPYLARDSHLDAEFVVKTEFARECAARPDEPLPPTQISFASKN